MISAGPCLPGISSSSVVPLRATSVIITLDKRRNHILPEINADEVVVQDVESRLEALRAVGFSYASQQISIKVGRADVKFLVTWKICPDQEIRLVIA